MILKVIESNEDLGETSISIEYICNTKDGREETFTKILGTDTPTFYDVKIDGVRYTIIANMGRELERFPGNNIWGMTARADDRLEGFFSTIIITKRNFFGRFRSLTDSDIMRIYASMRCDIVRNSSKNRKTIVYNVIK